uniref:Uncharacterized protein n=1 Tax=Anguilla anguilla TaxID=7936 RepID=A0A0E9XGK1_ANGAN
MASTAPPFPRPMPIHDAFSGYKQHKQVQSLHVPTSSIRVCSILHF